MPRTMRPVGAKAYRNTMLLPLQGAHHYSINSQDDALGYELKGFQPANLANG